LEDGEVRGSSMRRKARKVKSVNSFEFSGRTPASNVLHSIPQHAQESPAAHISTMLDVYS
jgi:hypothetical protein